MAIKELAAPKRNLPVYTRDKTINRLINDVRAMPLEKIKTLVAAADGMWHFRDAGGFDPFDGPMLVKAGPTGGSTGGLNNMVLGMNLMRWLTKYYFPDIVKGFGGKKLYRLQSSTKKRLTPGMSYKFKPHKPILSWTTKSVPLVNSRERENSLNDYIITSKFEQDSIIWSYKASVYRDKLQKARVDYNHVTMTKGKLQDESWEAETVSLFLSNLTQAVNMFKDEKEVVVYVGKKPFTAKVIAKDNTIN